MPQSSVRSPFMARFPHDSTPVTSHGTLARLVRGAGLLAAALLLCSPRPASADVTHGLHSVSVISNPAAGNAGYYVAGETITVRIRWNDASQFGRDRGDERMCYAQNGYLELDIGGTIRRATPSINPAAQTRHYGFIDFKYLVQASDADENGFNIQRGALHGRYFACQDGGPGYSPYREGETSLPVLPSSLDAHARERLGLYQVAIGGGSRKVNGRYRPVFLDDMGRSLRTGPDLVFYKDAPVDKTNGVNHVTLPEAQAGGFLDYLYEVSPALPAGVRLSQPLTTDPPVITGVPTVASSSTTYTLRTQNQVRGAELPFTLAVEESFHVTGVRITSRPRVGGVYAAGETIAVEVSFNRPARILRTGLLGRAIRLAALEVEVGSTVRRFTYTSGNGTRQLVFSYAVQVNDIDTDGISVQRLVELVAPGIAGVFSPSRTAPLRDLYYDLPGFTITNAAGHKAAGVPVTFGNVAPKQYTFYQDVPVDVSLPGAISAGVGTLTYTLALATQPNVSLTRIGGELTYTPPTSGDAHGGTIAGTPTVPLVNETYTLTARDSRNVSDAYDFYVQVSSRAVVTGLSVTSSPGSAGYYTAGDTITLRASFNRDVLSFANAALDVAVGGRTRTLTATHDGSSQQTYVDFAYTVAAEDRDTNGISIGADALSGTFRWTTDSSLPGALLTHAAVADQVGHVVRGTQTVPDFGSATVTAQTVTPVAPVNLQLPEATGGEAELTYTLTPTRADGQPDLPEGLSYAPPTNPTTGGAITGRPAAAKGWTTYTLTATDGDGDTDTLTFALRATDAQPTFGQTPADRVWAVGRAVADPLPAATGGDGSLRHTLTPALPAGLSFDRTSPAIRGTPTRVSAARTYTLTATDVDDDAVTRTFSAEVRQAGVRLSRTSLAFAEGGSATYTAVLTTPPAGSAHVTLESDNGDVTATPSPLTFTASTWATAQTVTVRAVRDADGEPDAATLRHTVNGYGAVTADAVTVTVSDADVPGVTVTPASLNVTEGRSATYTLALATQPAGAVTLTPSRTSGSTDVTVSAAVTFGPTDWATPRPVTVSAAVGTTGGRVATIGHTVGGYGSVTASDVSVTVIEDTVAGVGVSPTHLTVNEGGTNTYTVVLATQPSGGVTVTPSRISGSTDVTVSSALTFGRTNWSTAQAVTVRAGTDTDGEDEAATLSHTVSGYGSVTASDVSVTVDDAQTPGVTVGASGLTVSEGGSATYTVVLTVPPTGTATVRAASDNGEVTVQSGSQPAAQHLSLTFDASDYHTAQTVTVHAAEDDDADQDTATLRHAVTGYGTLTAAAPVSVTVTENETTSAPDFGAAAVDDQDYRTGKTVSVPLPAATGGNGGLRYRIEETLPGGLSFDATSRLLSGTPAAPQAVQTYTYTVHDADGDTTAHDADTLTFGIGIETNATPRFGAAVPAQRYKRGAAVGSPAGAYVELPAATGGNGTLAYTLEGAGGADLPAGLTFAAATRRIAGTPSVETAAAAYTYTATDSDGDTATRTVVIRVVANQTVSFGSATVAPQTYMQGSSIPALTLPEAQGGDGALGYTLPGLPAGLTYTPPGSTDHHGGTLAGAPQMVQAAATYTLTATDADGDTATLDFTIAVEGDPMPGFGHTTVPAQRYKKDKAASYVLPTASGGNAPLRYALTGPGSATTLTLPDGLTYTRSAAFPAGHVTGTPTAITAAATYTLTATDADGDTATVTFTLEVRENKLPAFPGDATTAYRYQQWERVDPPRELPAITGDSRDGPISYSLLVPVSGPGLPAGLTYRRPHAVAAHGGTIVGVPTAVTPQTTYTLSATDEDGDTVSLPITFSVDGVPLFRSPQRALHFSTGQQADERLVPADGGDPPLRYTLIGPGSATTLSLPDGLTYTPPAGPEAGGGRISGAPTATASAAVYTLTARDGRGADTATVVFTLEVGARPTVPDPSPGVNRRPSFEVGSLPGLRYLQNRAITPLQLPAATGGDGRLSYRVEPALPAGLTYTVPEAGADGGGIIRGTPTVAAERTPYRLIATDTDGDQAFLSFTLTVTANGRPTFAPPAAVPAQRWVQYAAIAPLRLPAASGGDGAVRYLLTGPTPIRTLSLPAGLRVHYARRMLTGTPTTGAPEGTYTWTARDADGDTAALTFTIEVLGDLTPTFGTAAVPAQRYVPHRPIAPVELPAATGGTPPLAYALTPALPAGLTFDVGTRVLSGTPTEEAAEAVYRLTATDADGYAARLPFALAVTRDGQPASGLPTFDAAAVVPAQRYALHRPIAPVELPAATGGTPPLRYALTPALPAGLTFDAATRVLSGTPTEGAAEAVYRLTATDADGNAATLTFPIEVVRVVLSVADAPPVMEGAAAIFPVTLSEPAVVPVTLAWTTVPGTAAAGEDYRPVTTDSLTLGPGEREGRLTVQTLDDSAFEPIETFTVRVTSVTNVELGDSAATGTIRDDETEAARRRALGSVLAGVGRTLATDAVDVIGGRFTRQQAGATLGGQELTRHDDAGQAAAWRRAAGMAYGVARALGVEVVSPLDGGWPGFGPADHGAWGMLTRSMREAGEPTWSAPTGVWDEGNGAFRPVGTETGSPAAESWDSAGYRPEGLGAADFDEPDLARVRVANGGTVGMAEHERRLRTPVRFRRVSMTEMLAQSRFEVPLGRRAASGTAAAGNEGWTSGWTLWGRGTASDFQGRPKNDFRMEGDVFTGYVGLDYRLWENVLLGVAAAHSRGDVEYAIDDAIEGEVDVELTSVLPYAHWRPRPGLGVWGLLGAGWGDAELADTAGKVKTDLEMLLAAVGARQDVATWRGVELAVKTDAFFTELEAEDAPSLPRTVGDAQRVRLMLEGGTAWALAGASELRPSLEVGGRWDGGKAERGFGAELGGGLAYTHTKLGLGIEARGRYLLAHEESAFEEWGASLTLRLDPGRAGRGLWLAFAPGWGAEASRVVQMWDGAAVVRADDGRDDAQGLAPQRFELDLGYGLATHEGAGLLTTYGGVSAAGQGTAGYRLGSRIEIGEWIDVAVEGERAARAGAAEHCVMLRGRLLW